MSDDAIEAVIFDVDGTLIDSVDAHAKSWQETFAEFGHTVSFDAVRSQIGKGGDLLMKEFLSREEIESRGKKIESRRKKNFQRDHLPAVRGFPGVRPLFERPLGDGRRIALASSAAGDELAEYKRRADIADLIDTETSKDDAEKSKPHPGIFRAALERLGNPSLAATIVIGGLRCGGFPEDALRANGCMAIFDDPAGLLHHYAGTFPK